MLGLSFSRFRNSLISNSAVYMAGNVLSQALAFFVLPVFTRYLSPADYGIFNYTTSIQSFIIIFSTLSLNSFVLRYYFEIEGSEEKRRLFGTIFLAIGLFSLLLLILGFLALPAAIKAFQIKVPFNPFFAIALVSTFLETASVVPLAYYRVTRKAWRFFWLTSSKAILTIALSLLLVAGFKMGILGRYYGILFFNALFVVVYLVIMFRVSALSFDLHILKKGLFFSLPILPAAFAGIALVTVDRLILERYVPISQLGIYSVGFTLGTALLIVVRGFYFAVEPELYKSFNTEGYAELIMRLKNSFLHFILLLGCILIVFSREFVGLFVTEQFHAAAFLIPFFVLASIFQGIQVFVDTTLYALNKTIYQPLILGGTLLFNIGGNLLLVPSFGITGSAITLMLSYLILYLTSIFVARRFTSIKWVWGKDMLTICAFSGLSIAVMLIRFESAYLTVLIKTGIVLPLALLAFARLLKGHAAKFA